MAIQRKKKHATKVSLIVSTVFHTVIIGALIFFAAREGYLGKQLKTIAVTMAPKEKPPEPEKPKEPEKPVEPPPEQAKPAEPPPQVVAAPPPTTSQAAPPPTTTAPAAAPPAVGLPAFSFSDGAKAVESSSDPVQLYKGFVEFSLRSKWLRPEGVEDRNFVAEVEVNVSPSGQVTGTTWKRGSGHAAWDESVRRAVAQTTALSRPPPKNFPGHFLVRFDVVEEVDANSLALP